MRITFTCILYPQCIYMWFISYIQLISLSSSNRYKFNFLLTCFQQGFIVQLAENRTGIAELESLWSLRFIFWAFLYAINNIYICAYKWKSDLCSYVATKAFGKKAQKINLNTSFNKSAMQDILLIGKRFTTTAKLSSCRVFIFRNIWHSPKERKTKVSNKN